MQEEFRQAYALLKQILFERHDVTPWERLFQPQHFFEVAKGWYVQVRAVNANAAAVETIVILRGRIPPTPKS